VFFASGTSAADPSKKLKLAVAIICRDYNLLFIMTPRTACTAIGNLLCEKYGGEFLPQADIVDSEGRITVQQKHSTLAELLQYGVLANAEAKTLLKVASVRNPFDTLVSLYLKQRYKYQPLLSDPDSWVNRAPTYARNMKYAQAHSFGRWVLRKCAKQMAKRALGHPPSMFVQYVRGMDRVLRYETISKDLEEVFAAAGMGNAEIPVINRTDERTERDYRTFYNRLTATAVSVAYSDDLSRWGYAF
jgi:hypothetical protein